jgi:cell wall-associated NlpC family hydrolase
MALKISGELMKKAQALAEIARGYLGVRFAHQGRTKAGGVDCLGLLIAIAEEAGLEIDGKQVAALDRSDYGTYPDADFLRERLETFLTPVPVSDMQVGDILLLAIDGRAQHLALVTDYPAEGEYGMIHAYAPARKVIEHRLDEHWKKAIAGVYRVPH